MFYFFINNSFWGDDFSLEERSSRIISRIENRLYFLFGCTTIVDTVVFPLADVYIHAVAGLAERNGKLMHPASLESGKLG